MTTTTATADALRMMRRIRPPRGCRCRWRRIRIESAPSSASRNSAQCAIGLACVRGQTQIGSARRAPLSGNADCDWRGEQGRVGTTPPIDGGIGRRDPT